MPPGSPAWAGPFILANQAEGGGQTNNACCTHTSADGLCDTCGQRMRIALFILRRLSLLIPIMLGISLVVFIMTPYCRRSLSTLCSPFATAEEIELKRVELGLDQPIPVQYAVFVKMC